jgi:hypothetical protein
VRGRTVLEVVGVLLEMRHQSTQQRCQSPQFIAMCRRNDIDARAVMASKKSAIGDTGASSPGRS